jgi:hypothetical protein
MRYYKYTQLNGNTFYVKVIDNIEFHIPSDLANSDYKEYLQWVEEGNAAEEYNPGGIE